MQAVSRWINGATHDGPTHGCFADVTNPATGKVSSRVALSGTATSRQIIAAAREAFPAWRETSLTRRVQILFTFRELLKTRKGELAAIITAEHGKVRDDALGEIARGQEVVEFACGIPHLLKGGHTENASTTVDVHSLRQPLGVAAIISPVNFPAMVPMWFFPVAIASGNTVILKPSEKDPTAANWMAELWKEAVDAFLLSPDVSSVSFVGSTPIARYVYEQASATGKRVQALDGTRGTDMGPLITAAHRDTVAGYIDAGEADGATLVLDGLTPTPEAEGDGFFLNPSLFDHVGTDMSIYTDEIFGGRKNSLFGDTHAHGSEGVHFFTRGKVVTTRWADPVHRGINLGFPRNS